MLFAREPEILPQNNWVEYISNECTKWWNEQIWLLYMLHWCICRFLQGAHPPFVITKCASSSSMQDMKIMSQHWKLFAMVNNLLPNYWAKVVHCDIGDVALGPSTFKWKLGNMTILIVGWFCLKTQGDLHGIYGKYTYSCPSNAFGHSYW